MAKSKAHTNKPKGKNNLKNSIVVVLLLSTVVFPLGGLIGVILMWIWASWSMVVKIIITSFFTLLVIVYMAIFGFLLTYMFLGRPFQIVGQAMNPNFSNGQYWMTKVVNSSRDISRGDVIVHETKDKTIFIKRIVGLPGETLLIKDGKVFIDGQLLDESGYVPSGVSTLGGQFAPVGQEIKIPEKHYFMLGDNREHSYDSRMGGFVSEEDIISEAWFCYFKCTPGPTEI